MASSVCAKKAMPERDVKSKCIDDESFKGAESLTPPPRGDEYTQTLREVVSDNEC